MGYSVYFKHASLKQIFTRAAGAYSNECFDKVEAIIKSEAPNDMVAGITGRPVAWNVNGTLTDSLKNKLTALPFVDRIKTNEEEAADCKRESLKNTVAGWVQSFIYKN